MKPIKPLTPHLWFDDQAREAADFYCDIFSDSSVEYVGKLHGTPSGDCELVSFALGGQPFMAISAGPAFSVNPSISFIINFDPSRDGNARAHLSESWRRLSDGGRVLMPLDEYFFSELYGWVQDRYGVSWQLILSDPAGEPRPFVTPSLLFTGDVCGKAEEAGAFYRSVFEGSREGILARYPAGMEPDREGTLMFSDFRLGNTWVAAMDSAQGHVFGFNEGVSFVVWCRDQAEIDYYWRTLSAVPEAEQCGWCKDRYGVSWQILPVEFETMLRSDNREAVDRVTRAFLAMTKFDLAELKSAFAG